MKTCTKCHIAKGLEEFSKKPAGKFGVNSVCRSCHKEYKRAKYGPPKNEHPGRPRTELSEKLKWDSDPVSGCWNWTRATDGSGYGKVKHRGEFIRASRAAWEVFVGPIGGGLFVLHKCDNRRCINPGHLYTGTHADNMRDMKERGRGRNQKSAPYTEEE